MTTHCSIKVYYMDVKTAIVIHRALEAVSVDCMSDAHESWERRDTDR